MHASCLTDADIETPGLFLTEHVMSDGVMATWYIPTDDRYEYPIEVVNFKPASRKSKIQIMFDDGLAA